MTKKSKEDAATSARRKAGARGLGVLEGKLARKKKGRVPGADLGTKAKKGSLGRGVRAAAHKDIPTTTAEEKKAAAGITAGMVAGGGAGFLAKQVGKQVVKKVATRAADKKARKVAVEKTAKKKAQIESKKNRESFDKKLFGEISEGDIDPDLYEPIESIEELDDRITREKERTKEEWKKIWEKEDKQMDMEYQRLRRLEAADRGYAKHITNKRRSKILGKKPKKAKGGYVKKYAKGGGVRAAR